MLQRRRISRLLFILRESKPLLLREIVSLCLKKMWCSFISIKSRKQRSNPFRLGSKGEGSHCFCLFKGIETYTLKASWSNVFKVDVMGSLTYCLAGCSSLNTRRSLYLLHLGLYLVCSELLPKPWFGSTRWDRINICSDKWIAWWINISYKDNNYSRP